MELIYKDDWTAILCGNCTDMKSLKGVDSVVTDPPYGLSFMGKDWDTFNTIPSGFKGQSPANMTATNNVFKQKGQTISSSQKGNAAYQEFMTQWAVKLLDAMKPGAHLLAFGGARTHHRLMCAIEDAGFEIRDTLMWVYGTGFPKSLDVSKAIDKQAGVKREVVNTTPSGGYKRLMITNAEDGFRPVDYYPEGNNFTSNEPITDEAKEWEGWGTALKPAWEPIILARKSLSEKTVAANVLKHGTGGLNIDGCRVSLEGEKSPVGSAKRIFKNNQYTEENIYGDNKTTPETGRFPANLIHDGSEEVVELFYYHHIYFLLYIGCS